jgi:hypothetical protein
MAKTIKVIDAEKFVNNLKKRKRKLRCTYTQSKKKGARIFRYIDYANLMKVLCDSLIEVSIEDIEVEDVPKTLYHNFEVEKYEVDPDEDPDESEEGGEEEEPED